jgi:hypothetical protein
MKKTSTVIAREKALPAANAKSLFCRAKRARMTSDIRVTSQGK